MDRLLAALTPAEDVLAELPYTTLERSPGPDDHDSRRRSLMIEVEWPEPITLQDAGTPVHVTWRDGYESEVATIPAGVLAAYQERRLYFSDPPGREAEYIVQRGEGDRREVARGGLADAIGWANGEIGDRYTFARRGAPS